MRDGLAASKQSKLYVVCGRGHKNIQHTVRYTDMAPDRFKSFWR
jgi:metal-dependent hydrolase (beta-lactamase superfamily II)